MKELQFEIKKKFENTFFKFIFWTKLEMQVEKVVPFHTELAKTENAASLWKNLLPIKLWIRMLALVGTPFKLGRV